MKTVLKTILTDKILKSPPFLKSGGDILLTVKKFSCIIKIRGDFLKNKPMKTNATRLLAAKKIEFETFEYDYDESDLSGLHIAKEMGENPDLVYKTLVTKGEKTRVNVFCIPVAKELDLKKCAKVLGDKKVEMIAVKDLLSLTGYIRGGCSPIGMKKQYPTFIDISAENLDKIYVSAGKRGGQIYINPKVLSEFIGAKFCDLVK